MRLKYYLRGAGCGMLISAILFAAFLTAFDWGPKNSVKGGADNSQAGRALVGDTADEAMEKERSESDTPAASSQSVSKQQDTLMSNSEKKALSDQRKEKSYEEPEDEYAEDASDAGSSGDADDTGSAGSEAFGEAVSITIKSGEGSYQVACSLRDAGLIDDPSDFDSFLAKGGYDHVLRTGDFELTRGMSYEEIAKKLTGR